MEFIIHILLFMVFRSIFIIKIRVTTQRVAKIFGNCSDHIWNTSNCHARWVQGKKCEFT